MKIRLEILIENNSLETKKQGGNVVKVVMKLFMVGGYKVPATSVAMKTRFRVP